MQRVLRLLATCALALPLYAHAQAEDAASSPAAALRMRAVALAAQLEDTDFGQPIVIESSESADRSAGEVYAVIEHPFRMLDAALTQPSQWCEVLILHLNVKHCASAAKGVALHLGSKHEQALEQAYRLDLDYVVLADTPDYLQVRMHAPTGPLGTRDYGFELEATAWPEARSFVHFRYSVGYGLLARLVMQGYLGSIGRDKVGFTRRASGDGDSSTLVGGARGAVERNAMRYYLAITSYLDSLTLAADERVERRLSAWFDATERYPRQLHEIERDEYLAMKRHELRGEPPPPRQP
jgi:hypothetical protein